MSIACIVEGQSEVESLPILLRRLLHQWGIFHQNIARPFRVKRNKIVKEGEIERAVKQVCRSRENVEYVIILLDANDDCPRDLAPELLQRSQSSTSVPVAIVMAQMEFESWFLGAKESLRGKRGIRVDASSPSNPESIRDAKGRISANMEGRNYLEVDDQPALTDAMDMDAAQQNCPSFAKLMRDLRSLINAMDFSCTLGH